MHLKNATRSALFALGFLSIGTQIYLVREFMMVFNDNELIIGLVLATWMLITGIGSLLGRFSSFLRGRKVLLVFLMLLAGVLPSLMVAGLGPLKVVMVPCGSMAGLWQVSLACLLIQLPFCLLNGFLFSFLSISSPENSMGDSYAWESLGSMASGALVNFVFLWFLGPFQGLLILTVFYLSGVLFYTRFVSDRKQVYLVFSVSMVCIILLLTIDFRAMTERLLYPKQKVISNSETPYGQVVVTKSENQFNFFENGMLLFSTANEISNEENVHYAMVQHPHPENILLISGGFSGTLAEILKYKPVRLDYVELNPSLIGIAARYTRQVDHPSVRVHEMDARRFIRKTKNSYDVVLVNLPAPSTLQLNRFYSVEFLREMKQKMMSGAVIAYSLPASGDYVSEQTCRLHAVLWSTLKQCFTRVLIIPVGRSYFLASDSALSLDIPGLIRERGIETAYVNEYYLDPGQLKERSAYVMGAITLTGSTTLTGSSTLTGPVNRDFTPVAVWYQNSWWMSQFKITYAVIMLVFFAILVVLLITLNPFSAGLFTGGFSLAAIEIILIFGLQVLCGYLFQAIGAIIMMFMLGLAAGSGIRLKLKRMNIRSLYRNLQILLAFYTILVPLMIQWMSYSVTRDGLIGLVIAILAFSAAFIVGMEYRLAALLSEKTPLKTVSGNYSAEMFGSAAGAFAVTLFLIPTIGMVNTGIFLAALNLTTAGLLFMASSKV
jgi:spermidine synthase